MDKALLIFAKQPLPGKVKTRLSPPFSLQEAADIYRCMLSDTLTKVAGLPGVENFPFFRAILRGLGLFSDRIFLESGSFPSKGTVSVSVSRRPSRWSLTWGLNQWQPLARIPPIFLSCSCRSLSVYCKTKVQMWYLVRQQMAVIIWWLWEVFAPGFFAISPGARTGCWKRAWKPQLLSGYRW